MRNVWPVKGEPLKHQYRALAEADEKPGHFFLATPGSGKSFLGIAEAGKLYLDGKIDGVLIFAPNGVHQQWVDEQLPLWADFPWIGVHNKIAPGKLKVFIANRKCALGFLSVNYESTITQKGRSLVALFMEKYPRIYFLCDEIHFLKSPKAKRTLAAMEIALKSTYRRGLTGTPILRGLEDIWSQAEIIQPGLGWPHEPITMGRKKVVTSGYFGFRTHYCVTRQLPSNPRATIIVGYRNEAELQDRLRPFTTRITSDELDVGETPTFTSVPTPMTPAQAGHYARMKEDMLTILESEAVTAQNALVQMGRLLTIASGFIYLEEGKADWVGRNKLDAVLNLTEQLDEPILVWAPFRALQQKLFDDLLRVGGRSVFRYSGREDISEWKTSGNGIMIGNQGSGLGVGQNLQFCAANIYVANTFNAADRWQSLKRTDRIGQARQVRVFDLTTPATVEVKVLQALTRKEALSTSTLDGLKRLIS